MKATSTEEFKDIIAIDFELQTFPNPDVQDKFIVSATNRDDIFAFVFEGPCLRDACRNAGLFVGWEKDQKIRELEKENKKLKALNDDLEQERDAALEENDKLRYAFDDEVEENKNLRKRILKLKELKTPAIENFEEPSTRADILRCAEKCVCGKREQDYDTPESNFQLIADLWNDYLKKERSSIVVDAKDVAMLMALMKIARIRNGGGSGDSFVDLAGYAACGGEIWHSNKEIHGDSSQETN